jgi:ankyrin repeat protein
MQVRPLHSAVAHADPSRAAAIANPLLEAGADANAQQPGGYTPLHDAVLKDDIELARLLLSYGANPHVSNDEGDSALQLAHAVGHADLIELFDQTFIS